MTMFRTSVIARLILVAFATSASVAGAQTSTTTGSTTTTSPATATNPTNTLVNSFTGLAGSKENATSLVNGLRTGSTITLTDPKAQTNTTTTGSTGTTTQAGTSTTNTTSTTFSPGTKPMGYGNIRIALSLAKTQLASQGITNPTPEQLQGALIGTSGTTGTATQGVLQMRASGMGWGQIANSMGVKLGAVMSGRQTFPAPSTTSPTGTTSTGTGTTTTTATGTSTTAAGNVSHGKSGITTAAGSVGGGVTTGLGAGGGYASSGAVNASGGRAGGGASVSNAGGLGRGKP